MATIQELENRLNALEKAFLQAQKNQVPVTAKIDDTSNKVVALTPYTDSEIKYIGDDDAQFFNVPQGMLSVSIIDSEGNFIDYTLERVGDMVSVYFDEPLENMATVTISVQ
jgi:hypothetical protein